MTASAVGGYKHLYQQSLHKIHGDIVRIGTKLREAFALLLIHRLGPNELCYANADGVETVLGTPGLPKGPCTTVSSDIICWCC
jgi:hypothetical protein